MKVLIADDHALVRDTVRAYLEKAADMHVVTAPDFPSAARQSEVAGPIDLALLDLHMPGMDGLTGLSAAIAWEGVAHVALFTGDVRKDLAERAMALGASGFVPKTLPAKSLAHVLWFIAEGEPYMPYDLIATRNEVRDRPSGPLTEREHGILTAASRGLSNKEIARAHDLSEATIKLHMKRLYRKLGVTNRTEAALLAKETGLL